MQIEDIIKSNNRVAYIGGSWGDAINWFEEGKEIAGFKSNPNIKNGNLLIDLAHHSKDPAVPIYRIVNVRYMEDPRDMFFADVVALPPLKNTYSKGDNWSWVVSPMLEHDRNVLSNWKKETCWLDRLLHKRPYMYSDDIKFYDLNDNQIK